MRLLSAKSEHLTVVSCVRRCSQTTRLPCVAEGGSFFTAADPAGERAPFETIGRYAFFHVRRACAPVVESRKSLIFNGFVHLLVSRGENDAFWAFARWSLPLMQAKRNFRSLKSLIMRRRPAIPWFHCRPCFVFGFRLFSLF